MPANRRSLAITDSYRRHLSALVRGADRMARVQWRKLDWANLDRSFLPIHLTVLANVRQAQLEAVRLTSGYLGAYLSSELGEHVDPPTLKAADYVGRSVTDRDLASSLNSPLIKVKVANKSGMPDPMGLGLRTMIAVVDVNVKHAARQSLQDAMETDERIVGWKRAVSGTCAACDGMADGSTLPAGTPLEIHPNCECVSEAVVKTTAPPVQVLDHAGSPAPGMAMYNSSLHGSARAALATEERAALDDALASMKQAHEWPEADAIPIRPLDPIGSMGSFRARGGVPQEISINEGLGVNQTATTVAHEMGHYLDNLLGKQMVEEGFTASRDFASAVPDFVAEKSAVGRALRGFLEVARESPTMRLAKSSLDEKNWAYINAPEEIWARAYSQWVTGKTSTQNSWEFGDFEPIGKAIEKVLKAAKLR